MVEIQDGITMFICRRNARRKTQTRKFRAECGSTVSIDISGGDVLHTESNHLMCQPGCEACKRKIEDAEKIIAATP